MSNKQTHYAEATPVYASLETEDESLLSPSATTRATDLAAPYFAVPDSFRHIPEARDLTWADDFFEDDDDVVAVFDLDYDAMESFYTSLGWVGIGLSLLYPPLIMIASAALMPCYLKQNITWSVRARHVAITRDGIRVVDNRRPCGWGLACCDSGKKSKTVPFDKITDCDIVEPAGNECICVPRVLFKVHIDTASSNSQQHELVLAGLQDPHSFKKLVWAMKRSQQQQNQLPAPSSLGMLRGMPSMLAADTGAGADIASLLREIRDELRQNNETLQAMKSSSQGVAPSAPSEEAQFV